jgi:hypothetical protein
MSPEQLNAVLRGALVALCWVAGLFFVRYWRQTGDRLFVFFVVAFWSLAAHWTALAIVDPAVETRHYLFLLRLLAFVALLVGIVDKNRRSRGD